MPLPSDVLAALSDAQVVACTLYGEARSEPIEGIVAVASVIRNRVDDGRWGHTYKQVCLAPWQFSCWREEGGAANHAEVLRVSEMLVKSTTLPDNQRLKQCAWVAQGVMGQWLLDNTRNSTHYLTGKLFETNPPAWARGRIPVAQVGNHVFLRGIP